MNREASAPARILIVGVQGLLRAVITTALARVPDLEIVGECQDIQQSKELLMLCRKLRPDLVLMGLNANAESRLERAKQVKEECPHAVVLTLINQENEDILLEVARANLSGYVPTTFSPEQLVTAIRSALRGGTLINRELAMRLLKRLAAAQESERQEAKRAYVESISARRWGDEAAEEAAALTPRELEVLAHVALGKSNREISKELHLSLSTVKTHLEHIFFKLGVNDRAQAVLKAVELELLTEPRRSRPA